MKADVRRRLPKIQDELEKSIHKAQSSLSLLPKAPSSDPRNEILSLLHEFMNAISRHVEGVPDEDGLLQAIRPAQERFRRAVRGTAPKFRPFERKYKGERRLAPAAFLSFEEGEGGVEEDGYEEDGQQETQATEGGEGRNRKHGDVVGHDVIYIDEVYERAHRLVSFSLVPLSRLTLFTVGHARESYRATTPLSFKLRLSTVLSRNGVSLLLSCAKLFMRRLWSIVRSLLRLILESLGRGRWSSASSQFPPSSYPFFLLELLAREREFVHFSRAELVRVISSACVESVPSLLLLYRLKPN